AGSPVAGGTGRRRAHARRHRRLPRHLAATLRGGGAKLRHRVHRLHRRASSLGVPGRTPGRTLPRALRTGRELSPGDRRMSVGVLLLTHEAMGGALLGAARHVLGNLPLPVDFHEVAADADPDELLREAASSARALDDGDGVLVLSDLYGATPCNVAPRPPDRGLRMHCVTRLN